MHGLDKGEYERVRPVFEGLRYNLFRWEFAAWCRILAQFVYWLVRMMARPD